MSGSEGGGRRRAWAIAEEALEELRLCGDISIRAVAEKHGVGVHQLRARIYSRYGSLAKMRESDRIAPAPQGRPKGRSKALRSSGDFVERKCMRCGEVTEMDKNHRMCASCRETVNSLDW